MAQLPKIAKVEAKPDETLKVTFRIGKTSFALPIRLSGFIARHRGLAPLNDPEIFKKAKLIDWGAAVGWPGDLDIGASTLLRMGEEQAPFATEEFVAWQQRLRLSNQEAADALGVTLTTVKNLRAGRSPVSNAVAIACRAMEADPAILAAHYRPRTAGRPKAA